jgi:hypothetical protein
VSSRIGRRTFTIRGKKNSIDGKDVEVERNLNDDDYVYIQENYTVTDGIYIDENIIFSNVTEAWKDFCQQVLQFEIPVYEPINIEQPEERDERQNGG